MPLMRASRQRIAGRNHSRSIGATALRERDGGPEVRPTEGLTLSARIGFLEGGPMSRPIALMLLFVLASSLAAQSPAPLQVPYRQFRLANGLTVILHQDKSVPVVAVNVWYHVGSANEKPRTHRLRAPVRAPDVRGVEERQGRRVRHPARSGRRQQQRIDVERSHELRDRRAVERAGARAVPRIGPHGLPARHDDARTRQRAARRREERAPAELRESAVRHGIPRARQDALAGRTIPTAGRRSARWRT